MARDCARACHPIVTATACDHYARARAARCAPNDASAASTREREPTATRDDVVVGALYGRVARDESGRARRVEIVMAVEGAAIAASDGTTRADAALALERDAAARRTRDDVRPLGWYRVVDDRDEANEEDLAIGDAFARDVMARATRDGDDGEAAAAAVFALVSARGGAGDAPGVRWYERGSDGLREETFTVEMLEAERIVVDEVAKIAPEGRDSRSARFASSLESAATATTALRDRLAVVLEYLRAVKDGRAVLDRDVLLEVAKAMVVLRTSSSEALREDFADEYENTLVLNYLAAMTKTTDGLSEAIDKFHIVHGDHSLVTATRFHTRGRGMPPTPGHDLI